jgi:hypothetical protein
MLSLAKLLLSDTKAVAVTNGHVSTARTWEAGARQGCPLAPACTSLWHSWALSCWLQDYRHPDTQQDIGIRRAVIMLHGALVCLPAVLHNLLDLWMLLCI